MPSLKHRTSNWAAPRNCCSNRQISGLWNWDYIALREAISTKGLVNHSSCKF